LVRGAPGFTGMALLIGIFAFAVIYWILTKPRRQYS
jgi:hypothetical protein